LLAGAALVVEQTTEQGAVVAQVDIVTLHLNP
jgi:hypothetical protein